jgi:pimeloyl-ACP methyl ester carboxylesterase
MKFIKGLLVKPCLYLLFWQRRCCYSYFTQNKETKELTYNLRKNTNGSYAELSGGVTHYELDGPDSGKVVVLVHGFSVPYYIWNGTYEYLAEHGFRVLRYDEFGRGYSDRPDTVYNKALYMDQLKELIKKLELKQPVSLVGVSFGGAVVPILLTNTPIW